MDAVEILVHGPGHSLYWADCSEVTPEWRRNVVRAAGSLSPPLLVKNATQSSAFRLLRMDGLGENKYDCIARSKAKRALICELRSALKASVMIA